MNKKVVCITDEFKTLKKGEIYEVVREYSLAIRKNIHIMYELSDGRTYQSDSFADLSTNEF